MADKPNTLAAAKTKNPRFRTGKKTRTVEYAGVFTAANSGAGDKCVLAGPLSLADRISAVRPGGAGTPALTGATDNDLGFYTYDSAGALKEIDKDIIWNGVTLASALTAPNLLTSLNTSLDHSKNIGELLSLGVDQEPSRGVFLVLTTNAANTATGPLTLQLFIDIDEATTL